MPGVHAQVCMGVGGMGMRNVCQCVGHGMCVSLDSMISTWKIRPIDLSIWPSQVAQC